MEFLELIIAAVKSMVSFVFFTLDKAEGDSIVGYFFVFLAIASMCTTIFYYMFELIKYIFKNVFQFFGNATEKFFNLFQRKTKIEKVVIEKVIKVEVVDQKGKSMKTNVLEGL